MSCRTGVVADGDRVSALLLTCFGTDGDRASFLAPTCATEACLITNSDSIVFLTGFTSRYADSDRTRSLGGVRGLVPNGNSAGSLSCYSTAASIVTNRDGVCALRVCPCIVPDCDRINFLFIECSIRTDRHAVLTLIGQTRVSTQMHRPISH